jgi:hypothetical protein
MRKTHSGMRFHDLSSPLTEKFTGRGIMDFELVIPSAFLETNHRFANLEIALDDN